MKLKEIIGFLEEVAPLRFQEEYDNAGLLVGDSGMELTGVLCALDATEAVIDEAVERNCNLVVAHHPIIFRGIKKFRSSSYVHRSIISAIKNDVAVYAIHTNLDNVLQDGVNSKLAERLGLTQLSILRPHPQAHRETFYEIGAGALGFLEEPKSSEQFLTHLKDVMKLSVVKHTAVIDRPIEKVAICGGAGSFLLEAAKNADADAFVTSDYKYHEFFDADGRLMICDIGHYESEYFTIELLHDLISKKFPTFAAHCTKVITNPVFYS